MRERIRWIDIAKGICMISIVLGHLGINQINKFVYAYHLAVFFLLSGYTLKEKPLTKEYLSQKFKRLMVPYFITCLCILAGDIINQFVYYSDFTLYKFSKVLAKNIVRGFFASGSITNFGTVELGSRIGAIWFLPATFFVIVYVQLLLRYCDNWGKRFVAAILIAVLGVTTRDFLWLPFSIQSAMLATPFVLLGNYMKETSLLENQNKINYLVFLLIFAIGYKWDFSPIYFVRNAAVDWLFTPVVALASSMLVLGISRAMKHCRFLEYFGENSLICLCVHVFSLECLWPYYNMVCENFSAKYEKLILGILYLLTMFLLTWIIVEGKKFLAKVRKVLADRREIETKEMSMKEGALSEGASVTLVKRDGTMDILRAFLIMFMIMGHIGIDRGAFRIIYSVHMMAFVFISGYFYKDTGNKDFAKKLWKLVKGCLLPYAIFAVVYIYLNRTDLETAIQTVVYGMSYAGELYTNIPSVGPVYFILMIFVTRLIYSIITRISQNEVVKTILVIGVMYYGIWLGQEGNWLPWSADCAMVSVGFYHAATYFRKYKVLEYIKERNYLYFMLSAIWAYVIYYGSMDIAHRKYGNLGITVCGTLCGIVLIYQACAVINQKLPGIIRKALEAVGQSTLYILMIHKLYSGDIYQTLNDTFHLKRDNVYNFFVGLFVQLVLGVAVYQLIELMKRGMNFRKKAGGNIA